MKRFTWAAFIATVTLCLIMAACSEEKLPPEKATGQRTKLENTATTTQDIKKEAADLAKITMAYTEEQKALYEQKLADKLAEYNQQLEEIQTRLAMLNAEAKAEVAAEMEELDRKKDEMSAKALELKTASVKAYADLKAGLDKALAEMDQAMDQAMARFQQ